jgi:hypothetical protein
MVINVWSRAGLYYGLNMGPTYRITISARYPAHKRTILHAVISVGYGQDVGNLYWHPISNNVSPHGQIRVGSISVSQMVPI